MNNNNNRNLQNDGNSNIRLVINKNCFTYGVFNNINADKLDILSEGIDRAKNTTEKLVKIKTRTSETISINNIPFDECYKNGGSLNTEITADLYIIIKLEASTNNTWFAKPSIIRNENNGRPIIGTILYNINYLPNLKDNELLEVISIIFLHEFTHILGFTKETLQKKFLILTRQEVKNRMNSKTQTKIYVNGTTVIRKAKEYFNCPNLTGVELEDANGIENMTHWSQRILLGDYMISEIYYSEQAISEITLAIIQVV